MRATSPGTWRPGALLRPATPTPVARASRWGAQRCAHARTHACLFLFTRGSPSGATARGAPPPPS
eukprot:9868483-Lingulodinium_polyedra.AAC.1